MIPALSNNITGQGQGHPICEKKHIIVDTSEMTHRRNLKLTSSRHHVFFTS